MVPNDIIPFLVHEESYPSVCLYLSFYIPASLDGHSVAFLSWLL